MDQQSQPIPEAEILAQLKVRGFESGFQRTPLRDFRAKLISISGQLVTRFQPPRTEVLYNFEQVEVIESTEPFPFPIAQITVMMSNREQSAMGVLGSSIDKIINQGLPVDAPAESIKGQSFLVGKMQRWKYTGGHMMWDGKAVNPQNPAKPGMEVPRDCWEVIEVEGFATPVASTPTAAQPKTNTPMGTVQPLVAKTAVQLAIELLDGKTDTQFSTAAFSNDVIKRDGKMVSSLLGGQFIPGLIAAGIVVKNADGTYTVNKQLSASMK